MKHDIIDAETACIEAIGKLSMLYDYLDKKAVLIPAEETCARKIAGGEILMVGDCLEAVQRLEVFIQQEMKER